jgi:hypothetical protein
MILAVLICYGIFSAYVDYLVNFGPDIYECLETCGDIL